MKLLLCAGCRDVVALHMDVRRTCRCGSSSGQYCSDGLTADVWGSQAVLLGLSNLEVPKLILGHSIEPGQERVTVGIRAIPPWDANAHYHDESPRH